MIGSSRGSGRFDRPVRGLSVLVNSLWRGWSHASHQKPEVLILRPVVVRAVRKVVNERTLRHSHRLVRVDGRSRADIHASAHDPEELIVGVAVRRAPAVRWPADELNVEASLARITEDIGECAAVGGRGPHHVFHFLGYTRSRVDIWSAGGTRCLAGRAAAN